MSVVPGVYSDAVQAIVAFVTPLDGSTSYTVTVTPSSYVCVPTTVHAGGAPSGGLPSGSSPGSPSGPPGTGVSTVKHAVSFAPLLSALPARSRAQPWRLYTNTSHTPFVSFGVRSEAAELNATNVPSDVFAGHQLSALPGSLPIEVVLTSTVAPSERSYIYTSNTPRTLPSSVVRYAYVSNATYRPSALMDAHQ